MKKYFTVATVAKICLTVTLLIGCKSAVAFSQSAEIPSTGLSPTHLDTTFIFTSPRPLISDGNIDFLQKNVAGFELLLSNFGVGFGLFYDRILSKEYKFSSEIFFTGVKNTDELKFWNSYFYDYRVPDKVRRIYAIPLSVGMRRYIDIGMSESFRPFVGVMAVPTLIWEMPYNDHWFSDVKYSQSHFRIGGGMQIGADFGAVSTSFLSIRMRYIHTPFGGGGLESVRNSPIKNFGGFYISLALGGFF